MLGNRPVVLGIDPGFAAIGWSLVLLLPNGEELMGMGVFTTEKSDAKRNVRAADDNVRRAREIAAWARLMFAGVPVQVQGAIPKPSAVMAETMSFPRSAAVAAKIAMTWGVIVAHLEASSLPLLQASPQEVKIAACGVRSASKIDVAKAMRKRFGARAFDHCSQGTPASLLEHPVDALASIVACLDTDLVRMFRRG